MTDRPQRLCGTTGGRIDGVEDEAGAIGRRARFLSGHVSPAIRLPRQGGAKDPGGQHRGPGGTGLLTASRGDAGVPDEGPGLTAEPRPRPGGDGRDRGGGARRGERAIDQAARRGEARHRRRPEGLGDRLEVGGGAVGVERRAVGVAGHAGSDAKRGEQKCAMACACTKRHGHLQWFRRRCVWLFRDSFMGQPLVAYAVVSIFPPAARWLCEAEGQCACPLARCGALSQGDARLELPVTHRHENARCRNRLVVATVPPPSGLPRPARGAGSRSRGGRSGSGTGPR